MAKNKLFLDGLLIPAEESFIETLLPSRLTGKGVFETMRAYNATIFLLEEHLDRLTEGLDRLNIRFLYTKGQLRRYLYHSLRLNKLEDARLRLTVWQEKGKVRNSIVTLPYRPYPESKYKQGFRACISLIRRDEHSRLLRIKSIKYLPFMRASLQAERRGNDEAILVNRKGYIVEGSRTNIFYVKEDVLYTPALSCGCLEGITRRKIIEIAKQKGMRVKEVTVRPQQLFTSDEAFLTNSLLEVMPLSRIEKHVIGNGRAGTLTKKLLSSYRELVKKTSNSPQKR